MIILRPQKFSQLPDKDKKHFERIPFVNPNKVGNPSKKTNV